MSPRWILILALPILLALTVRHLEYPRLPSPPPLAEPIRSPMDPAAALRALGPATLPANPWLSDLSAYTRQTPGRWVVGRSTSPCLCEKEAIDSARADAAVMIDKLIARTAAGRGLETPWLHNRLSADVRNGALQMDQRIEHFDRPYGTIFTAAVLVDGSPVTLMETLRSHDWEWLRHQRRISRLRLAAAFTLILAWLAYLLLNSLTRGYFTRPLWLMAAALNLAAIVLLI